MTNDPALAAYRKQNGIPLTPGGPRPDPQLVTWIQQAAQATGADAKALLATALQESGGKLHGPAGDAGTSYGPFQFHVGGALGSHAPAWASTYDAVLNRAREFARLQVHGGKGAASVQRPRDPQLYAKGVQGELATAARFLGVTPAALKKSVGAKPTTSSSSTRTNDDADLGHGLLDSLLSANASLAGISSAPYDPSASPLQRILNDNASIAGIQAPQLPAVADTPATVTTPAKPTEPARLKVTGSGAHTAEGVAAVNLAKQYLGVKYQWGGESPKGFDCSGLLQYVWAKRGVNIPRVTTQQIKAGRPVGINELQPGDAIFFGTAKNPHHVGMYIGNGRFIESPHTGATVRISNLSSRKDVVAARRYA